MDDLISRQAAIDAVCMEWCNVKHQDCRHPCDFEKYGCYWCDGCETALKTLPGLPSTQPDWIPCSEVTGDGYPEKEGIYYVTEQNYGFYLDDTSGKERVTHTSLFINGTFIDRVYSKNYSNITAWMPLLKPYEGEQDDN